MIPTWKRASAYSTFKCQNCLSQVCKSTVSNSSNTRQRTLLGFQSPSAFEKASRRRGFLMHADFEILVKSGVVNPSKVR